ncbi:hypothetical protein ASG49_05805 [Marmoricola sp. Leaf446]|uniref:hypothetical protein n=1 Tax=Marmoricola sp. Leaf446 TaxID=1736379 RepID=UPI0007010343|nr:hypothetical protein [Marmoricola sp. Leaf446]KQT94394.1 hypothetical protein ASG49_05805 [Marmoricola sp. Leaf446]
MRLRDRFRRGRRRVSGDGPVVRASDAADEQHLREFIAARRGVEGFVEPRTTVTDVTLLLVAHDGEWTRRRVPSVRWAHDFCNRHGVPSYDAGLVGIPQRMREWNHRQSQARKDLLRRSVQDDDAGR